ncbi:teichuronic acid biosynthesis protein TuaB [Spirochaetia bacterium]|nr:teichuronic acid biosynthesis protein TuaB [Spirochaetia bacterium]
MDLKTQAFQGVKWTSLASVCNVIIQFLRIVILARILEKSDFGLMAIVSMIMGFMNLFSEMGISSAILHRQTISINEYSSLYWFNLIVNTILFLFVCLITPLITLFYQEPQLTTLIPLMGINLFFTAFGRQFAVIAQKELHFKLISLIEILTNIISMVPAVILALNSLGVYSLIYSTLFASFSSNILYFLFIRKGHKIIFHYKLSETKPFLKIGIYQVGGQIINYFNTQFDVIIIGKLLGTESLGVYNLAKNLAMRPAQIINPIVVKIAAPVLSKVQTDLSALKRGYLRIIKSLSCINYPVYFFIAILSAPIIKLVYDIDNREMTIILSILSFYYMLRSTGNPLGGLVIATGRTDIEFYWNVGMLIVTPAFIYLGCRYSLTGAAIVQLLIMVLGYIPGWKFLYNKLIGVSLKEYSLQLVPYLLFSSIIAIIIFLFLKLFVFTAIISIVIGFILFALAYIIIIRFFDKEMFKYIYYSCLKILKK